MSNDKFEPASVADRFGQLWSEGREPNIAEFLAPHQDLHVDQLVQILRIDQAERWSRGERIPAEYYLAQFPQLRGQAEAIVEVIACEYLLRKSAGEAIDVAELSARFPDHAEAISARLHLIASSGSETTLFPSRPSQEDTQQFHRGQATPGPAKSGAFGRYNILRPLGRGGMGEVYLAEDTVLHRQVAIKVPRMEGAFDTETKERFYREARAAARLMDPHLCPVFDVGEIEGQLFIAMPYIQGQSLAELLRRGPLPQQRAAEMTEKLALALNKAHAQGILHRDLKPGNIMVAESGDPIVMDFGLARLHEQPNDAHLTTTGTFVGTPAYAPPEQLQGDMSSLSPASDVYSLGVILFEMLTGRLPFAGSVASVMKQVLLDPPPRPSSIKPGIDPALEAICLQALAKQPGERYPAMADLARALREALRDDVVASTPVAAQTLLLPAAALVPPQRPLPSQRKSRLGIWMARLGLSTLLLGPLLCCGTCVGFLYWAPEMIARTAADLQQGPNWDDLAEFWRPPAKMPPDFIQLPLQGYDCLQQTDVAEIPGFQITVEARHAQFRRVGGTIDLYVAKASSLEKEAIYRKVLLIIKQHHDDKDPFDDELADTEQLPEYPHYPDRSLLGSATQRYLQYRHRQDYKLPGDAAVFWWDEGWLFVARTNTDIDPRFFLRDVLSQLNASNSD